MVLGNLTAIVQSSVKRLLAYSAIAHAGYMLLGVLSNTPPSASAMMFYVITYALTTIGAFGVVFVVEEATGGDAIDKFQRLEQTRAGIVTVPADVFCCRSAAFRRWRASSANSFCSARRSARNKNLGLLWLVILAIAMSAVSFYYYLRVLKAAYVEDAAEDAPAIRVPLLTFLALALLALLVILFGFAPGLLTQFL